MRSIRPTVLQLLCLSTGLLLSACGGGGSSGASSSGFKITGISVKSGQEWKINRPIDITFNRDVDFSTVSLNTIRVSDEQGNGATGFFTRPTSANGAPDQRRVRFQPACPTREDNSDAGLQPFTTYQLTVLGSKVGGLTVRSTAGDVLNEGKLVTFRTPNSNDPLQLFLDTVPGPPAVRTRGVGGVDLEDPAATHVEVGGVAVYFTLDLGTQKGRLPAGFEIPLNHYSIPENHISVILHFNQPVLATTANINPSLLGLEFFNGVAWTPVPTQVRLIENCTETGAAVRLTPAGIVPQESQVRAVVRSGFSDLTGDSTSADSAGFALMDSVAAGGANPLFPGVTNPEADGVLEPFVLSGTDPGSLEDFTAGVGAGHGQRHDRGWRERCAGDDPGCDQRRGGHPQPVHPRELEADPRGAQYLHHPGLGKRAHPGSDHIAWLGQLGRRDLEHDQPAGVRSQGQRWRR